MVRLLCGGGGGGDIVLMLLPSENICVAVLVLSVWTFLW